jgi:hypothetical protein
MKKTEEVAAPMFNKGETVFSVLTGEKLTIVKTNACKGTNGVSTYTVAPKNGEHYRATEGELDRVSPFAPKTRRNRFESDTQSNSENEYDNRRRRNREDFENDDFSEWLK